MTTEAGRPTPKAVDELIVKYSKLQGEAAEAAAAAKAKADAAGAVKAEIIALVQAFGAKHAEKSKRLSGIRTSATVTTGTMISVDDDAVDKFKAYLDKSELPELTTRFFSERVTYQLVDGPHDVLKTLSLATAVRGKITKMLAVCFQIRTKAPSLKVDVAAVQA